MTRLNPHIDSERCYVVAVDGLNGSYEEEADSPEEAIERVRGILLDNFNDYVELTATKGEL